MEILLKLLVLLHPFLPFITDHLYRTLTNQELLENLIETTNNYEVKYIDDVISIISLIREFRNEFSISNKEKISYYFESCEEKLIVIDLVNKIANSTIEKNNHSPYSKDGITIYIKLTPELIQQEKIRLVKQIEKLNIEIDRSKNILSNEKFINSAPKEKVDLEKRKYENYQEELILYTKKVDEL